jgi:hypothetical protein
MAVVVPIAAAQGAIDKAQGMSITGYQEPVTTKLYTAF